MRLHAEIDAVATELAEALSRPAQAGAEIGELRRRIEEAQAPIVASDDEPALMTEARRVRRAAERRRLLAELELRSAQQQGGSVRQRLLELQLRGLRHRLRLHEPRVAILQQRIADLGRQELEALAEGLRERSQAISDVDAPALADALRANLELGETLVRDNERLAGERDTLAEQERLREREAATLRDSRTRLELGGTTDQVGRWLWAERRGLEPVPRIEQRLSRLRGELAELRLRLVALSDRQRELLDLPAAVRALHEQSDGAGDDDASAQTDAGLLTALLRERNHLFERLEPLLHRRIATLEQTERVLRERLDTSRNLQQTLDRHLLWIPSHAPIQLDWLSRVPAGLYDLVKPSRLLTSGQLLSRSIGNQPLTHLAGLALILALWYVSRSARAQLETLAQSVGRVRSDRFRYTLLALAWTVLASVPWALAAWLLGISLQNVGEAGRYSDSLGRAVAALALPILTLSFLAWLTIERGLGHAHLRWTRPRRESLRRWLPLAATLGLSTYFIMVLAFIRNQDLAIDVQARLAIIVFSATAAAVLWQLLAPGRLWTPRGISVEPSSLRRLLRVLLPAIALVCAGLAGAGYVYTAAILVRALFASVGIAIAVAVLVGLLARWFLLGERRLALHRLEQRREAEAEAGHGDSGEARPEIEDEVTLEMVNAQSRRLLRALRWTIIVLGLAWVWAEVLPAFSRLDEIALWHFRDVGADGVGFEQPVTLMALLLGLLTLVLTVIASRNLPGLIEIGLLSRANVDAALRYAITSVARYAIVITGVLIGLSLLGLRWSQLQWMAAALSVGLGFGLQEIFANFVSGLILLFERPFRVGDVITIGDLSGTVTRIRTRATTILDFDNKEIVVPNKTFITGQLINWTLSDTTTRVTVKVGVAYGSDAAQVHELLLRAAGDNPRVLAEPPPRSWFLAFGASSLDFELRVFVANLSDRLATQNELNMRIAELFAEHDIEIAFPQLDLHVRDVAASVAGPLAPPSSADPST